MATYEELAAALKAADAAGNEDDARKLADAIANLKSTQSDTFNPAPRTGDTIDEGTLAANQDWLQASRIHYKYSEGKDFEGTDEDLAKYGLNTMGWFNYNLPVMGVDAARIQFAPEDHKKAFLYLMETYDDLGMSWSGVGRAVKGIAADPTTYVGLGTLGLGTAAQQGGMIATKQGIKALLKASARTAIVAGVEAGFYGGATSVARQSVEVAGGARDEISTGQVLTDAAVAGTAGAVLGSALDVGVNALRQRKLPSPGQALPNTQQAAPAPANAAPGTPPQASQNVPQAVSPPPGSQVAPNTNAAPAPSNAVPQPNPGPSSVQDVIAALKKAAPDDTTGNVPTGPGSRVPLIKKAEDVYNALTNLGIRNADDALDTLDRLNTSPDQKSILSVSVKDAAETVSKARAEQLRIKNSINSSPAEKQAAEQALRRIDVMQETLAELDARVSSPTGRDLGARAGGLLTGARRGLSVSRIIRQKFKIDPVNASPDQIRAAEDEFVRLHDEWAGIASSSQEVQALERQVAEARSKGDLTTALKLMEERDAVLAKKTAQEAASRSGMSRAYEVFNEKIIRKTNEYVISNVFSFGTLVVNAIPALAKTLYKPALNALVKGMGKAARAEMMATYSTMLAHQGAAFSAARAAFRYERALLNGDFDRVLEQAPAIAGLKGRVMRFFPRMLAATDEYFARINYQGFVAGQAAAEAAEAGIAKGLDGDALSKFVQAEVKKRLDRSTAMDFDTVNVLDLLRQRGKDRGLSGPRLEAWIKSELDKNGELFKQGVDQAGLDYADDMLFKRAFSGENSASKLAQGYESFVNRNPIMRLAGQLFFRTPVRVFQEGIRLTPGLQIIDPTFLPDLIGRNGPVKQVRAQGEAMMSYAIAASVIAMYASGKITGAGPTDYKQRRELENSKKFEPYTIRFGDGSSWSYRNLDPLATPVKIIVNVLDRINDLEYRRAQGEKVDGEIARAWQYMNVGMASTVQAIRDASLTTGLDQLADAWDALTKNDDTTTAKELEKLLGKKLQLAVPAVVSKSQQLFDNQVKDPATLEQYVMARLRPATETVPKRYDALGRPVTISNPFTSLFGPVIPTTKEMREAGMSEKEQTVLSGLADLAVAGDTNFAFPYKMPGVDLDLRRQLTADGKETLYDRAVKYYRESRVTDSLYRLFADGGKGSMGTAGSDGSRLEAARSIINAYRRAAFARVMREEVGLKEEFTLGRIKDAEARAGRRDVQSMPYR